MATLGRLTFNRVQPTGIMVQTDQAEAAGVPEGPDQVHAVPCECAMHPCRHTPTITPSPPSASLTPSSPAHAPQWKGPEAAACEDPARGYAVTTHFRLLEADVLGAMHVQALYEADGEDPEKWVG